MADDATNPIADGTDDDSGSDPLAELYALLAEAGYYNQVELPHDNQKILQASIVGHNLTRQRIAKLAPKIRSGNADDLTTSGYLNLLADRDTYAATGDASADRHVQYQREGRKGAK